MLTERSLKQKCLQMAPERLYSDVTETRQWVYIDGLGRVVPIMVALDWVCELVRWVKKNEPYVTSISIEVSPGFVAREHETA